jgi:hypothetical protein
MFPSRRYSLTAVRDQSDSSLPPVKPSTNCKSPRQPKRRELRRNRQVRAEIELSAVQRVHNQPEEHRQHKADRYVRAALD